MASVDKFIILNCVQLEKGSNMYRNRLVTDKGTEKYITVGYKKKGCLDIPFNQIEVDNTVLWQEKQRNFIFNNYRKKKYFSEIWGKIEPIFYDKYNLLYDVVLDSMRAEFDIFGITTEIVFQDTLNFNSNLKSNELLIELCHLVGADTYLSGNGAKKYIEVNKFSDNNVSVYFQQFAYPRYDQGCEFVPNLSGLDILFNCGIEKSRQIFWETVNDICKKG